MGTNEEVQLPPSSIESEQSLLGGLMQDNSSYESIADIISETDFYQHNHRQIFRAISTIIESGKQADAVTVFDKLNYEGNDFCGLVYLGSLVRNTPSSRNARRYAEIVLEKRIARDLIGASITMHQLAYGSEPIVERLEKAQSLIENLHECSFSGEPVNVNPILSKFVEALDERFHREIVPGLISGLNDLDEITQGFKPGNLVILAGRPGSGKSALAMQIAEFTVRVNIPVLVFSLEMTNEELIQRMISGISKINGTVLGNGRLKDSDWHALTMAVGILNEVPLFIDDSSSLTVAQIRAKAKRAQRQHNIGLIVVDYLQLLSGPGQTKEQEVSNISKGLKSLAKDLKIPVIALSQLSRESTKRQDKRPVLSDLRDCLPVDEWVDTPCGPMQLRNKPDSVITIDKKGSKVEKCFFIEKQYNSVCRVVTRFGSFSATANHLVLTGVGWKKVKDIVPGRDVIACPKIIAHANRHELPHGRLLGWLIGNGNLFGTPNLVYRNELDADVISAVGLFGVTVRRRKTQKSKNVIDAYLSNGVESGSLVNPLMSWIRSLGLEGKKAQDKFIPSNYLGSSDQTHKDLLRGLWESDGTVTGGMAKYTTCSEILARQVKWLLHTIGVRSTINRHEHGLSGLWKIRCSVQDNERMKPICSQQNIFGELSIPSQKYIDPAPSIFVELVSELYFGKQRLQKRADGSFKQICKSRMLEILKELPIKTILQSPYIQMDGIGWSSVSSVSVGHEDVHVCDLNVPSTHCFITNGLVVHNSGSLEQDSHQVIFVHRDDNEDGVAQLLVRKNRGGPTGDARVIWRGDITRFENFSSQQNYTNSYGDYENR